MDLMGNSFNAVSCLEAFAVAMCVARLDVAQSSPREDQAGQFEDQADQVKGATQKRAHSGSRASRGRGRGRGGAAGKRARGRGRGEAVAEWHGPRKSSWQRSQAHKKRKGGCQAVCQAGGIIDVEFLLVLVDFFAFFSF